MAIVKLLFNDLVAGTTGLEGFVDPADQAAQPTLLTFRHYCLHFPSLLGRRNFGFVGLRPPHSALPEVTGFGYREVVI